MQNESMMLSGMRRGLISPKVAKGKQGAASIIDQAMRRSVGEVLS